MTQIKQTDKRAFTSTPIKKRKKNRSNENYSTKAVELAENSRNRGVAG